MSTPTTDVEHAAISIAEDERTFVVLGRRAASASRPLVLVFHGSRQSAEAHRRFTGDALMPLAADERAVVVYLDGYRGNWNDARRESSFATRLHGTDDVAFTRAVVEQVGVTHGIDPDRVVMVGYSNGGQMVLRLLHEAPELVADAVVIAATLPAPGSFLPVGAGVPARPTPFVLVHGTRDPIVAFDGGSMSWWARAVLKVGGRSLSAPDTAAYMARRNGITSAPSRHAMPSRSDAAAGTSVIVTAYREQGRPPVILYAVEGGGHTVPGPRAAPRILGRTATDVTVLELVADAIDQTDPSGRSDAPPAS